MTDKKVQQTAEEALSSKISAKNAKYFCDPFATVFVSRGMAASRKPPLINRGYYARVECINSVIAHFLSTTASEMQPPSSTGSIAQRQIINLGVGLDSLSLQLLAQQHSSLNLFDVDFPNIMQHKANILGEAISNTNSPLSDLFSTCAGDSLDSFLISDSSPDMPCFQFGPSLRFVSADLRHTSQLHEALVHSGVNFSLPTLIITECVLVYVSKEHVLPLYSYFAEHFSHAQWCSYDMVSPDDAFGKVMQRNIAQSGIRLPGFSDFPTLDSRSSALVASGWDSVDICVTMKTAYDRIISKSEKMRITRLELLDEVEEYNLLMGHYCLTVASVNKAIEGDGALSTGVIPYQLPPLVSVTSSPMQLQAQPTTVFTRTGTLPKLG